LLKLRKLLMLAAMLALVLVAAAPAIAQVSQEQSERRITSGAASPKTEISNKGNNVNLCPTGQQATQTGNVANEQGAVQYASKAEDIDFSGSELTLTPSETAECTQTIEQSAAAAPAKAAPPPPAPAPAPAAAAPAAAAAAPAPAKAAMLPPTGGLDIAPLLGLGAGALLVAGGLLARRIIR
jgi:outer membrane autotransporter protein